MTKEQRKLEEKRIISDCMQYFKTNRYSFSDRDANQKIEDGIKRVFQLELEELGYSYYPDNPSASNFKIEFYHDTKRHSRASHHDGENHYLDGTVSQVTPRIRINTAYVYCDLNSENVQTRMESCVEIFRAIFHEIRHERQRKMLKTGVSSKDNLRFARDYALYETLEKEWYSRDTTKGNYGSYYIENDANEDSYNRYLEVMENEDSRVTGLRDIETGKKATSRYKVNVNATNGGHYRLSGMQERDDATTYLLDMLIGKEGKTYILNWYPILRKEYNDNGSRKTAIQLIRAMEEEEKDILQAEKITQSEKRILIQDAREMYYELIYKQVERYREEQIYQVADSIGSQKTKRIFGEMQRYFDSELKTKLGQLTQKTRAQQRLGITSEPEEMSEANKGELTNYYFNKKRVLNEATQTIEEREKKVVPPTKPKPAPTPKPAPDRRLEKMEFVTQLMKDYLDSENLVLFKERENSEEYDIKSVLQSVKDGKLSRLKASSAVSKGIMPVDIVRLLVAADNITIEGRRNYLKEFVDIPEVSRTIDHLRNSQYARINHTKAEELRRGNNIYSYKTIAQEDKQFAQEYLMSGRLLMGSVQDEIKYRHDLTESEKVLAYVGNGKIPRMSRQTLALTRVLARQDGKVPGDLIYDKNDNMWYCYSDTNNRSLSLDASLKRSGAREGTDMFER